MFEGFFFVFSAFKENVIEGDGPKNQTQSKMDLYVKPQLMLSWLTDYNQRLRGVAIAVMPSTPHS